MTVANTPIDAADTLTRGRDIVFLLGAGFSADLGLPIISRFGEASSIDFARFVRRHLDEQSGFYKPRHAAPIIARAHGVYSAFVDFCRRSTRFVQFDPNNMEDIFTIAEVVEQTGCKELIELFVPRPEGKAPKECQLRPAEIFNQIKLWLWYMYRGFPPHHDPCYDTMAHERFVNAIKKHSLASRTVFVTTNYDISLETIAANKSLICAYPINSTEIESLLLGVEQGNTGSRYVEYAQQAQGRPLVAKLHGSVNFFERGTPVGELCVADCFNSNTAKIGVRQWPETDRPGVFFLEAIWQLRHDHGSDLTPAIVPPTYAKLHATPWLRAMWAASLKALTRAKHLVIIGYSLPNSDGFMRGMIQAAMAGRSHNSPLNLWVIDPDPSGDVFARYRDMFQANAKQSQFICAGFADAVKSGHLDAVLASMLNQCDGI